HPELVGRLHPRPPPRTRLHHSPDRPDDRRLRGLHPGRATRRIRGTRRAGDPRKARAITETRAGLTAAGAASGRPCRRRCPPEAARQAGRGRPPVAGRKGPALDLPAIVIGTPARPNPPTAQSTGQCMARAQYQSHATRSDPLTDRPLLAASFLL